MFKQKILLVDDDDLIKETIELFLTENNYNVISSEDGKQALKYLDTNSDISLIITDISMPEMNGIELSKVLKKNPKLKDIPILFLTVKTDINNKFLAFRGGEDDYLSKPFDLLELLLRVENLIKRYSISKSKDLNPNEVYKILKDKHNNLTAIEIDIIYYLIKNKDKYITSEEVLVNVFKYYKKEGNPGLVRVHIKNIREKIENDPKNPKIILNVKKKGYLINLEGFLDEKS